VGDSPHSIFLPTSRREMLQRSWDFVDVVLVTGDAYVDHPAFGTAVIGRMLEQAGYRVGIIAMPDWRDPDCMTVFGRPRLFFGIGSGNVDSMLSRYTAFLKVRRDDPYVPGGQAGKKPERALIVYSNLAKSSFKESRIVLGGIEASMRRIVHYDFWSDTVRRSILADTRADILAYGMAEKSVVAIADRLRDGKPLEGIPGTVHFRREPVEAVTLPSEEEAMASRDSFLECYRLFYTHQHETLSQPAGGRFLLHHPPAMDAGTRDLDAVFDLPFTRLPHPDYPEPVPAFGMIHHSVISHRGCVSGCSFCSLSLHQGRRITSRSESSILREVRGIASDVNFRGHISDVGGPTANMYGYACSRAWKCGRESCLSPRLCPHLKHSNRPWLDLLERVSRVKGVKRATVGSGIRYDLFMLDPDAHSHLDRIVRNHVSGQLKIAPESVSPPVLNAMRKQPLYDLGDFVKRFRRASLEASKRQYLLPYLMTCHPGSKPGAAGSMRRQVLALFGFLPKQAQAFIPLPMTLSSVVYHTGRDPLTGESIPVMRGTRERRREHDSFLAKPVPAHARRSGNRRLHAGGTNRQRHSAARRKKRNDGSINIA